MNRRALWIPAVLALCAAAGWTMVRARSPAGPTLSDAQAALRNHDHQRAARISRALLERNPKAAEALMIAAMAAAELGDFESAVNFCGRVDSSAAAYPDAQCMAGNLYLSHLADATAAEQAFRQALSVDPDHPIALNRLAYLLSLQTRTWEVVPIQLRRIRRNVITPAIVLSLVHGDLLFPDADLIATFRRQQPDEAGWLLAESRRLMLEGEESSAEDSLRQALEADPELVEAHARLGEVLDRLNANAQLESWRATLPPKALQHPLTWMTLGRLAERGGDRKTAARCYLEAGQRDAASISACYLLGKQLASLGRHQEAEPFLQRARALEKYRKLFDHGGASSVQMTPELLLSGVELADSLGLAWESYALARIAATQQPPARWAVDALGRQQQRLADLPLKRTAVDADIFHRLDLSEYPLPGNNAAIVDDNSGQTRSPSAPHFDEVAASVGIDFQFDNGVNPDISGAQRPYDFTGGGIAAFDYDCDGWPDLFCAQGCRLDDATGQPTNGDPDALYRNIDGDRFADTSLSSLPASVDYSQGVSAGDINNDGFPDLFVANLGLNRLLINNGDGTFSDWSRSIVGDAGRWTTSCLICDLNGDHWPDLYSVNYLSGDITSRICRDESGRLKSCAPQSFPASQDQLHLADGRGGFRDATEASGIGLPDGKGLGIMAIDANSDCRLDLFIANDGVPNFLLENRSQDGSVAFENVAMQRGVAVNRNGLSEACMGIVAEDLNLDHRTDLFVTNFLDESNTYYAGSELAGYFDDRTFQTGLGASSVKMLGFGAQALDADLDGLADLFIANGHVDDFTDRGVAYHMPPQFFQNLGDWQFAWVDPDSVGSFFRDRYLGRSVARMDWNRDGSEEVAISNLDAPLSLLRNSTPHRGRFVTFTLRAVTTQRDAIGAIVTVVSGAGRGVQRQLVAGDGYQASNQRALVFGLGDHETPVDLTVEWPSGKQQRFSAVDIMQEYVLVEGDESLFLLIRPRRGRTDDNR